LKDTRGGDSRLGLLLAFAYPERIAQRKEKEGQAYVTVSGEQAKLPPSSRMSRHEYLVVADADVVGASARIFLCAPITREELVEHFGEKVRREDDVRWDPVQERVIARRVTRIGAIVLSEQHLPGDDDRIPAAMADGIRSIGIHTLPWDKQSLSLRERCQWLRSASVVGADWPDLSETNLTEIIQTWLVPFLSGIRQRDQLHNVDLYTALKSLFSQEQLRELDRLAPSELKLPSGTIARIDYSSGSQPVLAVRLQELFGQADTPRVGKGNIPLLIHLLSPAKRPLAVTQDLPSFWTNVYPGIRRQLQAKYPKHIWPEDPMSAKPTSKTKRQITRGR
jgi:ATP-dependent helicase HrpB